MIGIRTKLEPSDVDAYDWDWLAKYGDDLVDALAQALIVAASTTADNLPLNMLQRRASLWATERGANLLSLHGDVSIVDMTRSRVRDLVSETLTSGDSLQTLTKKLREDFAFSKTRAVRIARTETAMALGQGKLEGGMLHGDTHKRWFVNVMEHDVCVGNQAQGWIPIHDAYQSGHQTVPAHPNCMCNIMTRRFDDDEEVASASRIETSVGTMIAFHFKDKLAAAMDLDAAFPEVRCTKCDRLLGRNVRGGEFKCTRCGEVTTV